MTIWVILYNVDIVQVQWYRDRICKQTYLEGCGFTLFLQRKEAWML